MRKLGGTVVMNIHAGEFPVNQSRSAEGESMPPVVRFAGEGMCTSGLGHSITNFCCVYLFCYIYQ